jgi:copper chaperone CopZ
MKTVTFDTNTVDDEKVVEAARAAGFEITHVTVTDREIEQSDVVAASGSPAQVVEPFVLDESCLGSGVLASDSEAETLEKLLNIISNGSFPPAGHRDNLSPGQKRQLRDAMILSAHIREGREIFVTNDVKGFIRRGRRELLEREFGTRIMTSEEFLRLCKCGGATRPL